MRHWLIMGPWAFMMMVGVHTHKSYVKVGTLVVTCPNPVGFVRGLDVGDTGHLGEQVQLYMARVEVWKRVTNSTEILVFFWGKMI